MPTAFLILLPLLLFLTAFILIRTISFAKPSKPVEAVKKEEFFSNQLAEHLSLAVQCKTISQQTPENVNQQTFLQLRLTLQKLYPRVHRTLERIELGTDSLFYRWQGTQNELDPVVLTGHLDVVPVDPATETTWHYPAFSGMISDGYIWGRGTIDDKSSVITLLEAIEHLIGNGYKPSRTLFLAFGHDEESASLHGALRMANWLKDHGYKPAFVMDEGGQIMQEVLDGIRTPVAMIGIGEKGYLTTELSVEGAPGHSAQPPKNTAIGVLAKALVEIEKHPLPANLNFMKVFIRGLGNAAPFLYQLLYANLWLFKKMAIKIFSRTPLSNAGIRTTTAVTLITGGIKDNLLPQSAHARVNYRLLPGDTIASVMERTRRIIHDDRVHMHAVEGQAWDPPVISPIDTPYFRLLEKIIKEHFDNIPVAPFITQGATDAHHYTGICNNVVRFIPFVMEKSDLQGVHGVNERIKVDALVIMAQFYYSLIRELTSS